MTYAGKRLSQALRPVTLASRTRTELAEQSGCEQASAMWARSKGGAVSEALLPTSPSGQRWAPRWSPRWGSLVVCAGAGLVVVGGFLPWGIVSRATEGFGDMNGGSIETIFLAGPLALLGLLLHLRPIPRSATIVLSLLAMLLSALITSISVTYMTSHQYNPEGSIGIGLSVTLLGGVVSCLATLAIFIGALLPTRRLSGGDD